MAFYCFHGSHEFHQLEAILFAILCLSASFFVSVACRLAYPEYLAEPRSAPLRLKNGVPDRLGLPSSEPSPGKSSACFFSGRMCATER